MKSPVCLSLEFLLCKTWLQSKEVTPCNYLDIRIAQLRALKWLQSKEITPCKEVAPCNYLDIQIAQFRYSNGSKVGTISSKLVGTKNDRWKVSQELNTIGSVSKEQKIK